MATKKNTKISRKKASFAFKKSRVEKNSGGRKRMGMERAGHAQTRTKTRPRPSPRAPAPDVAIRKVRYSKVLRSSVLISAIARQRLIEMGGENTINIVREFDKDMSDEELARKIGIKASDVRVVLNRLHSRGLFHYTRVRDKDSGWYSYIWKMNEGKLKEFVESQKVEVNEITVPADGELYVCKNCAPREYHPLDRASEMGFKCSECGNLLEFLDRKEILEKQ